MENNENLCSITLRIPQHVLEWLDEHHWCAKTSRSAFASKLLVRAVEDEQAVHADDE